MLYTYREVKKITPFSAGEKMCQNSLPAHKEE
jgi:hypothetical protein